MLLIAKHVAGWNIWSWCKNKSLLVLQKCSWLKKSCWLHLFFCARHGQRCARTTSSRLTFQNALKTLAVVFKSDWIFGYLQKGLSPESLPGIVSPAGEQNHSLQNMKINPQVLFGVECKGRKGNQEVRWPANGAFWVDIFGWTGLPWNKESLIACDISIANTSKKGLFVCLYTQNMFTWQSTWPSLSTKWRGASHRLPHTGASYLTTICWTLSFQ